MSAQHRSVVRVALFGAVAVGLVFAFEENRSGGAGQPPAPPAAPAVEERQPDKAAVQKALDGFAAAFRKGDGKAVAAFWTAEGEYVGEDGVTLRGRAAIEKAYTEYFSKSPGNALEVEVESVRFPSKDTAVVEGHFKLRAGKKKELVVSRCSFLYAREGGNWLLTIAREWPGDGLSLRDLEWLIGTWEAKRDGTVVRAKYEWTANRSFIRCQFSVAQDGSTQSGMQIIGKDPALGALRVWTFEDDGGIGDTDITRDGKKWVHAARGLTADGRMLTSTNIITPIDADSFQWHAVDRALDGEELPDLPPVTATRVNAKP